MWANSGGTGEPAVPLPSARLAGRRRRFGRRRCRGRPTGGGLHPPHTGGTAAPHRPATPRGVAPGDVACRTSPAAGQIPPVTARRPDDGRPRRVCPGGPFGFPLCCGRTPAAMPWLAGRVLMRPRPTRVSIRPPVEPLEGRRLLSTTYYVSPAGKDTNPGTSAAKPLATLAAVNKLTLARRRPGAAGRPAARSPARWRSRPPTAARPPTRSPSGPTARARPAIDGRSAGERHRPCVDTAGVEISNLDDHRQRHRHQLRLRHPA